MVAGVQNILIAQGLNPFLKTTVARRTTRAQTVVMRTSARLVTKPVIADGNDAPPLNLKPLTPKTMKKSFEYIWNDQTGQRGDCPRERVAFLLRAARTNGRRITAFPGGYKIGLLYLMHKNNNA